MKDLQSFLVNLGGILANLTMLLSTASDELLQESPTPSPVQPSSFWPPLPPRSVHARYAARNGSFPGRTPRLLGLLRPGGEMAGAPGPPGAGGTRSRCGCAVVVSAAASSSFVVAFRSAVAHNAAGLFASTWLCFDTPGSCSHEKATALPVLDTAAPGFMAPSRSSSRDDRRRTDNGGGEQSRLWFVPCASTGIACANLAAARERNHRTGPPRSRETRRVSWSFYSRAVPLCQVGQGSMIRRW